MNAKRIFTVLAGALVISACSSPDTGRYSMQHDQAPTRLPTSAELTPLEPRYEPLSRQGNMSSYTVFGTTYQVLPTARDYNDEGLASWYGKKFHGHLTSNGEHYDMYGMSAAHRYLPLPTYVRVTNLSNGKDVIVRVNDRGPFHPDRIIDLSYAAAHQLDMLNAGVAPVRVEALYIPAPESEDSSPVFIQISALSDAGRASQLRTQLEDKYQVNATTAQRDGLHRLLLGPFNEYQASEWLQKLRQDGYEHAFRVTH